LVCFIKKTIKMIGFSSSFISICPDGNISKPTNV
jgi:hypothetical protein